MCYLCGAFIDNRKERIALAAFGYFHYQDQDLKDLNVLFSALKVEEDSYSHT